MSNMEEEKKPVLDDEPKKHTDIQNTQNMMEENEAEGCGRHDADEHAVIL